MTGRSWPEAVPAPTPFFPYTKNKGAVRAGTRAAQSLYTNKEINDEA